LRVANSTFAPLRMFIQIQSSVGTRGNNRPLDVMNTKAALNVYLRYTAKPSLDVYAGSDKELEDVIRHIQVSELKQTQGNGLIEPNDKLVKWLSRFWIESFKPLAINKPSSGLLTWEAEGTEGGRTHSRKLHVPNDSSGLTIGRGYDCAMRTSTEIAKDLIASGVNGDMANTLCRAAKLRGIAARYFIVKNDLMDWEISTEAQFKLFQRILPEYERRAKNEYHKEAKSSGEEAHPWEKLDQKLKDVLIDLSYRGDFTGKKRTSAFNATRSNTINEAINGFADRAQWPGVPTDRFDRRVTYLKQL